MSPLLLVIDKIKFICFVYFLNTILILTTQCSVRFLRPLRSVCYEVGKLDLLNAEKLWDLLCLVLFISNRSKRYDAVKISSKGRVVLSISVLIYVCCLDGIGSSKGEYLHVSPCVKLILSDAPKAFYCSAWSSESKMIKSAYKMTR